MYAYFQYDTKIYIAANTEWKAISKFIYLTVNKWGWVSYEELWRSRRVLSVEAIGRGR